MLTYAEKPEMVLPPAPLLPPAPRKLLAPEPEGMVKKEKAKVQRSVAPAPKKEEKPPTPEPEEVAPVKKEKAKYETDRPTPNLPQNTFLSSTSFSLPNSIRLNVSEWSCRVCAFVYYVNASGFSVQQRQARLNLRRLRLRLLKK